MTNQTNSVDAVRKGLHETSRWKVWEPVFWLLALASPFVLGSHALIINEIAIVALFAISLDLVLGYSGIVSLGHAAFFGMGAYSAALFAKLVMPDPLVGLAVAIVVSTILGAICSMTILRGSDLTRLMVTLGVALLLLELANKFSEITGGADGLQGVVMGPLLGKFEFDLSGRTAACYSLVVLLILFILARRLAKSSFGATLMAIRDNRLRAMAIGIPVSSRLAVIYAIAAGAAGAAGALLAQTTGFASLDVFAFDRSADVMLLLVIGGTGWLYGGVAGAVVFKIMQDAISTITPQYWTFWIGLFLVILMLVGRERLLSPWTWFKRGLFDTLTPLQTLALTVSQQHGLGTSWWKPLGKNALVVERCEKLLEQFHLTEVMNQQTRVLAYGKRRLLEIAIALACEPKVLLLDEPVAGVPAGEREELLQTVAALPADVSILLIEHDMDLVFSFAKRMTVLVNGTVLTEGDPEQIANDPEVKAVYLGHGEEGHDAGPTQGGQAPSGGSAAHEVASVGVKGHD